MEDPAKVAQTVSGGVEPRAQPPSSRVPASLPCRMLKWALLGTEGAGGVSGHPGGVKVIGREGRRGPYLKGHRRTGNRTRSRGS